MGILTTFARLLFELKNALNKLENTVSKYQEPESRKAEEKFPTEFEAVVGLPVDVTDNYGAENRERPNKQAGKKRLVLEFVAVGAAIFLSVSTFCTLEVVNGQLWKPKERTAISKGSFKNSSDHG
ncbi:MAG TPA: hypothetical protein VN902_10765 [Candidatus Acidoferrales bacterium]|jgi:hypothetical protein|nr:hypothetical protein [Candidatus Acidoferrales bacterium]